MDPKFGRSFALISEVKEIIVATPKINNLRDPSTAAVVSNASNTVNWDAGNAPAELKGVRGNIAERADVLSSIANDGEASAEMCEDLRSLLGKYREAVGRHGFSVFQEPDAFCKKVGDIEEICLDDYLCNDEPFCRVLSDMITQCAGHNDPDKVFDQINGRD